MKFLKLGASVVAILIVGVMVVLLTVDIGKYKDVIQDQAKAATGREVTIGDINLSLSLTPAIVISDVTLANAPWGSRPQMLTLKRLEASTQLLPLLFGTVNITGLKLVDPDAMLETNAQGKGNWEFDVPTADGASTVPLNISGVAVEGLKLAYRDGKTKGNSTVVAKSVAVVITGAVNDLVFPSIAVTEALASYREGGKAAEGSIAAVSFNTAGPITALNITKLALIEAKGSFKDGASAYEGTVASLAMTGEAAPAAAKSARFDLPAALKAMQVTSLTMEKSTAALKDSRTTATAVIGKVALTAKGKIGDLGITNIAASDGKLTYNSSGAPVSVDVATLTLDGAGALTLAAKLDGGDVKAAGTLAPIATLMRMNASFPARLTLEGKGLKATTDVTINRSGKRPAATGAVSIAELDLAALGGKGGAKPASAAAGGQVFSDEPLPWDSLTVGVDATVKVAVGKLTLASGLILTNVVLPVDLAAGKLSLAAASFAVAGGTVIADVKMDAGNKSVALKAEAKGLSAESLARELKKSDLITQGPVDLAINVNGSGNSVHAVMASLNGSIVAGMGESKIRSDALNVLGADVIMQVVSAINPAGNKDPYTVARCGVVNLQIANGVAATNNGIALVTDKMQVTSSGKIDFGGERVDLNLRPKATSGVGAGLGALAQAVKVSGPLSNPGIGVDKAGALKTLGILGAAFATGGASILAQGAADRLDGRDLCQAARTWHLKK